VRGSRGNCRRRPTLGVSGTANRRPVAWSIRYGLGVLVPERRRALRIRHAIAESSMRPAAEWVPPIGSIRTPPDSDPTPHWLRFRRAVEPDGSFRRAARLSRVTQGASELACWGATGDRCGPPRPRSHTRASCLAARTRRIWRARRRGRAAPPRDGPGWALVVLLRWEIYCHCQISAKSGGLRRHRQETAASRQGSPGHSSGSTADRRSETSRGGRSKDGVDSLAEGSSTEYCHADWA